jgi:BirA family biotin operon repressor/biotin-[acetyl-CoA-carboxylase] ligase
MMLTSEDLEQALSAIRVSVPVRAEEVTASTNATAASMAEDGDPEWTLVSAAHQTEGHGRLGRTWEDVPGRALMFSFVLRPALSPNRAGLLSLLAGASMAQAIREVAGRRATCKWPNDLLVRDRKVGGILLESSVENERFRHVVVGVGVNLDPPPGVEGATGLGDVPMRHLLSAFLVRFQQVYDAGEPSWEERVRNAWLPVSDTMGRLVEATVATGEVVRGRAVGIDGFGGLRLSTDTGEAKVSFGEIRHLHAEGEDA